MRVPPAELDYALRGARIQASTLARRVPRPLRPDWEDLVQEARHAVLIAQTRWTPAGGASWTTYAHQAVRLRLQQVMRQHNRQASVRRQEAFARGEEARPEELPVDSLDRMLLQDGDPLCERIAVDPDIAGQIIAAEEGRRLRALLSRMPLNYRSVLMLRYYQELSPAEIAAHLGVTRTTVYNWQARALAWLRAELTKTETD